AVKDSPALEKWNNISWWVENYGDENVLCKYVEKVGDAPSCTIKDSLVPTDSNSRLYVSGEARIFQRNPELEDTVKSDFVDNIAPGTPVFTQLFMGYAGMGSDVHSAIGCNMFRQIVGRKKWWLIPVSQTPYVYPSLNPNGFSAHTLTKIGKGEEEPSPWLNKLERYTVVLEPGDVMLNPPWFWHGILNLGESGDDLVIGVPTRYGTKEVTKMPSFRSNFVLSVIGIASIAYTYGLDRFLSSSDSFQNGIEKARSARAADMQKRKEEMERAM
ncbi:HSPBAP1, partial [Symbiodinium microadriaticum]